MGSRVSRLLLSRITARGGHPLATSKGSSAVRVNRAPPAGYPSAAGNLPVSEWPTVHAGFPVWIPTLANTACKSRATSLSVMWTVAVLLPRRPLRPVLLAIYPAYQLKALSYDPPFGDNTVGAVSGLSAAWGHESRTDHRGLAGT
jgi:hypothetical protein